MYAKILEEFVACAPYLDCYNLKLPASEPVSASYGQPITILDKNSQVVRYGLPDCRRFRREEHFAGFPNRHQKFVPYILQES